MAAMYEAIPIGVKLFHGMNIISGWSDAFVADLWEDCKELISDFMTSKEDINQNFSENEI